ncbi:hypothetical protein [Litchfieldella xinjiangensis]|nr:hypothetical protein [Halomonas xinjiangensis]
MLYQLSYRGIVITRAIIPYLVGLIIVLLLVVFVPLWLGLSGNA